MSKLILNKTGNVPFNVEESNVLKVYEVNSVTNVAYLTEEDGFRNTAEVVEAIASVAAMSSNLIALTDSATGETVYINKDRVSTTYDEGANGMVQFENAGTNLEVLKVDETSTAIQALMITKSGEFTFLNDSFTAAPNTVVLDASEGDQTAKFTAGVVFTVFGEGDANDAIFTVVSSAWTTVTTITVTETPIVNASASGYTWVR